MRIQDLRREAQRYPDQIRYRSERLREYMRKFNPLDVIANLRLSNVMNDPNEYKEIDHEGLAISVEYVALLLAKDNFEKGTRWVLSHDAKYIDSIIEEIVHKSNVLDFLDTRYRYREEANEQLELIRNKARGHEKHVRNKAYDVRQYEVLEGLFGKYEDRMREAIGYTSYDAVQVTEAIKELDTEKLNLWINTNMSERVDKKDGEMPHPMTTFLSREILGGVEYEKPTQFDVCDAGIERIADIPETVLFHGLGDIITHTKEEISTESGIPENRVERFLQSASIRFGEIDDDLYRPRPRHALKLRPILECKMGYCTPIVGTLDDALRKIIESDLNREGSMWGNYVTHRHDFTLDKSVDLLAAEMNLTKYGTNLYYEINQNSEARRAEVDAVLKYGNTLFILEVKAGKFKSAAREGKRLTIQSELEKLIKESHQQSVRAKDYIHERDKAVFDKESGEAVEFDITNITRTYLVSVTLETIGHITSAVNSRVNPGLISGKEFPWIVSIFDLMVICDLVHLGPMIPQYVERRLRAAQRGDIASIDELDYFGLYLENGLLLAPKEDEHAFIASHTTEMDSYYMYEYGHREDPAEKPRQEMPEMFERVVRSVANCGDSFAVENAIRLLDMGGDSREIYLSKLDQAAERAAKRGKPNGVHLAFTEEPPSYLIATYVVPSNNRIADEEERRKLISRKCGEAAVEYGISKVFYTYIDIDGEKVDTLMAQSMYNPFA